MPGSTRSWSLRWRRTTASAGTRRPRCTRRWVCAPSPAHRCWVCCRTARAARGVMVGVLAVIVASMGLLSVAHGPVAVGAVGLLGMVWSSYPVLTAAYVRDHVGARDFATAFAAMTVIYSIAAMFTPAAVGWLADASGSFTAPFVAMAALAAAAVLAHAVGPQTRFRDRVGQILTDLRGHATAADPPSGGLRCLAMTEADISRGPARAPPRQPRLVRGPCRGRSDSGASRDRVASGSRPLPRRRPHPLASAPR